MSERIVRHWSGNTKTIRVVDLVKTTEYDVHEYVIEDGILTLIYNNRDIVVYGPGSWIKIDMQEEEAW